MSDKSSCLDCRERHYLCHMDCERYEAWKKENEKNKVEKNLLLNQSDFDRVFHFAKRRRRNG